MLKTLETCTGVGRSQVPLEGGGRHRHKGSGRWCQGRAGCRGPAPRGQFLRAWSKDRPALPTSLRPGWVRGTRGLRAGLLDGSPLLCFLGGGRPRASLAGLACWTRPGRRAGGLGAPGGRGGASAASRPARPRPTSARRQGGAWRPARPAHLLGDPGQQLPADVAPGHAVQVVQLPEQQQRPALRVRVPGARLELQPHARHLRRPKPPAPATAPAALGLPLRPGLGAAPALPGRRPRLPRRSGPLARRAGPARGARGRRAGGAGGRPGLGGPGPPGPAGPGPWRAPNSARPRTAGSRPRPGPTRPHSRQASSPGRPQTVAGPDPGSGPEVGPSVLVRKHSSPDGTSGKGPPSPGRLPADPSGPELQQVLSRRRPDLKATLARPPDHSLGGP